MTIPPFDIEAGRAEWSSFLPALMACLAATTGDVLEIGVGHYSTPALHDYCERARRYLVSCEEDENWAAEFGRKYTKRRHSFIIGDYDGLFTLLQQQGAKWSVVLLDHSPGPRRAADMMTLIDRAELVVVHDYHLAIEAAFAPLVAGLHCHVVRSVPPTAVFSRSQLPASVLAL